MTELGGFLYHIYARHIVFPVTRKLANYLDKFAESYFLNKLNQWNFPSTDGLADRCFEIVEELNRIWLDKMHSDGWHWKRAAANDYGILSWGEMW